MRNSQLASVAALVAIACGLQPASAGKLDAGLFTLYSVAGAGSTVHYLVCGSLPQSEGCYASGNLTLDNACAVLEGQPHQRGNTVRRYIYVFDKRNSTADPALVNVYLRTDTITGDSDAIQVSLKDQIQTGLMGAPDAKCFMAGSNTVVYVGTNASDTAAKIGLIDSKVSQIRGSARVQSITADQRGYVTISLQEGSFYTFDPSGNTVLDGGGTYQMGNTRNGITTNK